MGKRSVCVSLSDEILEAVREKYPLGNISSGMESLLWESLKNQKKIRLRELNKAIKEFNLEFNENFELINRVSSVVKTEKKEEIKEEKKEAEKEEVPPKPPEEENQQNEEEENDKFKNEFDIALLNFDIINKKI